MSIRQTAGPIVWKRRQNSFDVRAPSAIWPSERSSSTSVLRASAWSSTTTTRNERGGAFNIDVSVCGVWFTARRRYLASCDLYNAGPCIVDAYHNSNYKFSYDGMRRRVGTRRHQIARASDCARGQV